MPTQQHFGARTTCVGVAAGVYTIAGVQNVYCDGNGYALLQQYKASCTTSLLYTVLPSVTPVDCGYLSQANVQALALALNGAQHVKLHNDGQEVTSNVVAANSLKTNTHWYGHGETWTGAAWSWTNVQGTASSWPQMYHSSGDVGGVHWLTSTRHSKDAYTTTTLSQTLLLMSAAAPTPAPTPVPTSAPTPAPTSAYRDSPAWL
jgi:hypothetical protein